MSNDTKRPSESPDPEEKGEKTFDKKLEPINKRKPKKPSDDPDSLKTS